MEGPAIVVEGLERFFIAREEPPGPAGGPAPVALPPDRWRPADLTALAGPAREQHVYRTGSGFAAVTALAVALRRAGVPVPLLSGTYPFIQGGGESGGGLLAPTVRALAEHGTCPAPFCPDYLILRSLLSPAAVERAEFRPPSTACVVRLRSVGEVGTALTMGAAVAATTPVDEAMLSGPEGPGGVLGLPRLDVARQAWCLVGLQPHDAPGLPWKFLAQGSFGAGWGRGGRAFLTAEHFERFARPVTAFAFWPAPRE